MLFDSVTQDKVPKSSYNEYSRSRYKLRVYEQIHIVGSVQSGGSDVCNNRIIITFPDDMIFSHK